MKNRLQAFMQRLNSLFLPLLILAKLVLGENRLPLFVIPYCSVIAVYSIADELDKWRKSERPIYPVLLVLRIAAMAGCYAFIGAASVLRNSIHIKTYFAIGVLLVLAILITHITRDALRSISWRSIPLPAGLILTAISLLLPAFHPLMFAVGLLMMDIWLADRNIRRFRSAGRLKKPASIIHVCLGGAMFLPVAVYMLVCSGRADLFAEPFPGMAVLSLALAGAYFLSGKLNEVIDEEN